MTAVRPSFALAAALATCGIGCARAEPAPGPGLAAVTGRFAPVVLVVLDSLRADRLGLGSAADGEPGAADGEPGDPAEPGARDTAPFLRELARHAIVFDRAYTTASWCRPAMASLLTARLPVAHGCDGAGSSLPGGLSLLPELLAAEGYDTQAVVTSPHLASGFGFSRGWAGYRLQPARPLRPFADGQLVREALADVLTRLAPPPFLLCVQWMDCHPPWGPHPESEFDPLYGGTFDGSAAALAPFRDRPPSEANLQRARDLYDGEIRWLDDRVRELFGTLDARGALADAWIVVTADHGLQLWDRGRLGHRGALGEEVLRVPLLVRPPGGLAATRHVAEAFSLVDLAPTLLDFLGLPPCTDFDGASWAPFLLDQAVAPSRPVVACEQDGEGGVRAAIIDGPRKLVHDGRRLLLFDLASDPAGARPQEFDEGQRLPAAAALLASQLEEVLAEARSRRPPGTAEPADAEDPEAGPLSAPASSRRIPATEVSRQLRALGEIDHDG